MGWLRVRGGKREIKWLCVIRARVIGAAVLGSIIYNKFGRVFTFVSLGEPSMIESVSRLCCRSFPGRTNRQPEDRLG